MIGVLLPSCPKLIELPIYEPPSKPVANSRFYLHWTFSEKAVLFSKHKELGNKWTKISKYLPSKSEPVIKNFFYSSIRKVIRKVHKSKFINSKGISSTLSYDHWIYILNYFVEILTGTRKKAKDSYILKQLLSKDIMPETIKQYKLNVLDRLPLTKAIRVRTPRSKPFSTNFRIQQIHLLIQDKYRELEEFICSSSTTLLPELGSSMQTTHSIL